MPLARAAALVLALAATSGCKGSSKAGAAASALEAGSADAGDGPRAEAAAREASRQEDSASREALAWENAKSGEEEDLATLAHEVGVAGLESGLEDPARKETALRALGVAPGFSQVARLAREAQAGDGEHARLALESLANVGSRRRRPVEHEDEADLAAGCETLAALARKPDAARARRVGAIRAHRLLPCPKTELPTDLDAR